MKELYLAAEMEIVKFSASDVIAASANTTVATYDESMGGGIMDEPAWDDIP